jgi:hypothetical protein
VKADQKGTIASSDDSYLAGSWLRPIRKEVLSKRASPVGGGIGASADPNHRRELLVWVA